MMNPTRHDYWVKGISNIVREEGTFVDTCSKLSKDIGDTYVAELSFIFPFVNLNASSTSFANHLPTKVKADINLRLAASVET